MLSSLFYRGSIKVMDDRSCMYRDSPQELWMMDYCNRVQGFINFATFIPRNFSGYSIRCPCRKCKNKKVFASKCCNDTSFTQEVHGRLLVLVCTRRTICS